MDSKRTILGDNQLFLIVWKPVDGEIFHQEHSLAETLIDAVEVGIQIIEDYQGNFDVLEINEAEGTMRNVAEDAAKEWFKKHGDLIDSLDEAPVFIQENLDHIDEIISETIANVALEKRHIRSFTNPSL